ncbi:MAG TPA: hypothetical protein PK239_01175 [Chitinophagales bacterium]|nr:hypothetical protein [Chitinophagales bacterium]
MNDINEEIGIYAVAPKQKRLAERLTTAFYYLFLHPVALVVGDVLWILVGIATVSWAFRNTAGVVLSVVLTVVLIIIAFVYSSVFMRYLYTRFASFAFGNPVFGRLGGLDKHNFFTMLRLTSRVRIDLKETDREQAKQFCELDNDITEAIFKERYYQLFEEQYKQSGVNIEEKWQELWQTKILKVGEGKDTFENARHTDNLIFRLLPLKLQYGYLLMMPFLKFFQLIGLCLIAAYLAQWVQLLTVFQVVVGLNFLLSALWYITHNYKMSEISLNAIDPNTVSATIYQRFADRINALQNKILNPINIAVDKSYFGYMRAYQLRYILAYTSLNSLFVLLLLILVMGSHALAGGVQHYVQSWYIPFAVGILLLPPVFYLGFLFISMVIQHFRKVIGALVVGITTAVLPFVIYYLVKGQFQINEVQNGIWAALSGITTIISTIVASQFKEILESDHSQN